MTDRLDEFQSYRKTMNAKIGEIDHLRLSGSLIWTRMRTKMGHSMRRQKNCWGWLPRWFSDVTIALIITSSNVLTRAARTKNYTRPLTSRSLSVEVS